jgi:hypothetical protein
MAYDLETEGELWHEHEDPEFWWKHEEKTQD